MKHKIGYILYFSNPVQMQLRDEAEPRLYTLKECQIGTGPNDNPKVSRNRRESNGDAVKIRYKIRRLVNPSRVISLMAPQASCSLPKVSAESSNLKFREDYSLRVVSTLDPIRIGPARIR